MEEAHEAAAAVRSGNVAEAAEELGDLLFMVLFMVHLYEEQKDFQLEAVCDLIIEKMIRRHPHVFGDTKVESTREVRENWEKIKAREKADSGKAGGIIPPSLPALMRAYRMISRLAQSKDSDWNAVGARAGEFASRSQALSDTLASGNTVSAEVFGQLLRDLVNLARLMGHRAEDCLHDNLRALETASGREK
jgi:uncharacterized protein YabN with tetrapyrrole methylase and pyrophosphatase domain